ncbi:hypothetical protein HHK36_018729 [Tetracentron sinense]|uniref:Uncharacterized protein n=1 Tax=Tetracentron sinense TaxID=13715 RepID=A0A834YYM4_TETSI|nr:hypothetical protein HHK36_018729 [Tetracentron sinense]
MIQHSGCACLPSHTFWVGTLLQISLHQMMPLVSTMSILDLGPTSNEADKKWATCEELKRDMFLEESTFVKWWKTLPGQHRSGSCIARLMDGEGRNLPSFG